MKSILFVVLIAIAISSSFAVKIKGSCPKPEKPKVDYWNFANFLGSWTVLGRSEQTEPNTVYNTLEIDHLHPGKVFIMEEADVRTMRVQALLDKYIEMTVGDFGGKSYYETYTEEYFPFSFNITTSDGHRGLFWMPYYANPMYAEAVVARCVKIDDSTVDVKAWFIAKDKGIKPSQEVKSLIKSLTRQNYIEVCQGSSC